MAKQPTSNDKSEAPAAGATGDDSTTRSATDGGEQVATVGDLHSLFREMLIRDQEMWIKVTERDNFLQGELTELFRNLLETNSVNKALDRGFPAIIEHLKAQAGSLRALGREYQPLDDAEGEALDTLNRALARPDFSLDIDGSGIRHVPFNIRTQRSSAP